MLFHASQFVLSLLGVCALWFFCLISLSLSVFAQHPLDVAAGKALFERAWVSAPSSTAASDGLGPLYNARSCNACHPDGGRGRDVSAITIVLDDAVYGRQLQPYSIQGLLPEVKLTLQYEPIEVELPDGTSFTSSRLQQAIQNLRFGELQSATSARIAPSLFGVAALASVSEATIKLLADPDDHNADGISGRVALAQENNSYQTIGRFGLKAEQASLSAQVAKAFSHDLGLSSAVFPSDYGDCSDTQLDCLQQISGAETGNSQYELNDEVLRLILAYLQALSPPKPDLLEPEGLELFTQIGCADCHRPSLPSAIGTLGAYTDLLLHDMGPGLADKLNYDALLGSEWRTAPLWGLSANSLLLHDGRAKSPEQAILWHAGEASDSRLAYLKLDLEQKQRLIAFLIAL